MAQILALVLISIQLIIIPTLAVNGSWKLLQESVGISIMHMQLLKNDKVIMFDRTDFGPSNISFPASQTCPNGTRTALCTAHSVEYTIATKAIRPIHVDTDFWCSGGSVAPDGTLLQAGGTNKGARRIRIFRPCDNGCEWEEIVNGLDVARWYATSHILPDGREIIIGGRGQFNYEFYPKTKGTKTLFNMPFLSDTTDPSAENNLYPYVFLTPDGNLFVFANTKAILFDYINGVVVKTFPSIPDGNPRNYPSTGSAVLLPLRPPYNNVEVLLCGGAPKEAFAQAMASKYIKALNTCGRMRISDPKPVWTMETMPFPRLMGDMLLLPNGNVLIINGASAGVAGWDLGREPVLNPVIYIPNLATGSRFEVQDAATRPRMYHSTAILARDGRVLVGGSNAHNKYSFTGVMYPTDLSLEAFSPSYLDKKFDNIRPKILSPVSSTKLAHGQVLIMQFNVKGNVILSKLDVTMVQPSFATHSFAMNQRLVYLERKNLVKKKGLVYEITITIPSSKNICPSGQYMVFLVHQEIPSEGIWVSMA